MIGDDKRLQIENIKREIAKLEWEESLLKKRDDRLRWEQQMMNMENGLKARGEYMFDAASKQAFVQSTSPTHKNISPPHPDIDVSNIDLEAGSTYLLFESAPKRSIELFLQELHGGKKGLYITRSNPTHVKRKFDLGESKLCWLTSVKASEDVTSVSGLQELSILVSNQIDNNPQSAIFLDGLEYLISNNDFSIVLRLIQQIRDKVSTSDSILIMPFNNESLEQRQVTLLERECNKID